MIQSLIGHHLMLTEEERSQLVEIIQRTTRGRSWEERLRMADAWAFMSSEVYRLAFLWGQQSHLPPEPQPPPQQLELPLQMADRVVIDR